MCLSKNKTIQGHSIPRCLVFACHSVLIKDILDNEGSFERCIYGVFTRETPLVGVDTDSGFCLRQMISVCVLSHAANLLYTLYCLHIHSYIHKGNQGNCKGPVS